MMDFPLGKLYFTPNGGQKRLVGYIRANSELNPARMPRISGGLRNKHKKRRIASHLRTAGRRKRAERRSQALAEIKSFMASNRREQPHGK